MYYCQNCGAEFELPERRREDVGEYMGRTAYEDFYVCPSCGSDDVDEMMKCEICEEYVPAHKMAAGVTRDVCEECCRELETVAAAVLYKELSAEDYEIISEWLDLPELESEKGGAHHD